MVDSVSSSSSSSASSNALSSLIQMPGLISGLDTQSLIQKMMAVESAPLTQLQNEKAQVQQTQAAYLDINTRLSALLSSVQNLTLRSNIDAKTVATDTPSSSPTLVTATAGADATSGSFTVKVMGLATATTVTSNTGSGPAAIGNAVAAGAPLASAGFGIAPTTGTFTVNGVQITIDSSTVLSDGTDAVGADTIFAKIRDATSSLAPSQQVNVSWGLDANGRQNKLVLTSAGNIQLGSGSDTSNFLTAAGLAALPSSTTMTSVRNLGTVNPNALLNSTSANLAVPLSQTTGTFSINGVQINYDASVDTLNTIIGRINSSAANVTASYDSVNDQITLTAKNTGGALIDLQDVSGNFLAAMKVSKSYETVGQNASYLLNGQQMYSTSNTVTDALPGITLNLVKADPGTTVTLTVNQDTSTAVNDVQDFITKYNAVMDDMRQYTSWDDTQKQGGILLGDSTVQGIENKLAVLVSGQGIGVSSAFNSLSAVGITTGAIGSTPGTTNDLVLDSSKLTAALQSNPNAVADLFAGLTQSTTLAAGGTGSIGSISGNPTNHVSGTYSIASDALGNLTSTFTPTGGGAPVVTTGAVTASGMNTTLIPGLILSAKSILAAGTDTITANFSTVGVGVQLQDYLTGLTSSGGVMSTSQDAANSQIADINKSMQDMQDRLDQKQQDLTAQFASLETALAQLQGQSASLSAQLSQMSSKSS